MNSDEFDIIEENEAPHFLLSFTSSPLDIPLDEPESINLKLPGTLDERISEAISAANVAKEKANLELEEQKCCVQENENDVEKDGNDIVENREEENKGMVKSFIEKNKEIFKTTGEVVMHATAFAVMSYISLQFT